MTERIILTVFFTLLVAASLVLGFELGHAQKIISDQREYIELGCQGRYQGEE